MGHGEKVSRAKGWRGRAPLVAAGVVIGAAAVVALTLFARGERAKVMAGWEARLTGMADDRRLSIEGRVSQRLGEVEFLAGAPPVVRAAQETSASGAPAARNGVERESIAGLLRSASLEMDFTSLFVLGPEGEPLCGLPEGQAPTAVALEAARGLLASGLRRKADFYLDERGSPATGYMARVATPPGARGAVVFGETPAGRWFYPVLARQPTPTASAETLLVRREGARIVFLSPLRFVHVSPLEFSVEAERPNFAGRQAADGVEGFGEFVDYRGVPVLAVTRPIPGTSWGLVSKVDVSEALAPYVRFRRVLLSIVGLLALALMGIGSVPYGLQKARHARAIEAREARVVRLNRLLRVISRVDEAIVRGATREAIFEVTCRTLVEDGGFRMAWIGRADRATGEVSVAAAAGEVGGYLAGVRIRCDDSPEGRGPSGTAIRTGRPSLCGDIAADPAFAPWRAAALAHGFRSSCAYPIAVRGETVAAIMVYGDAPGAIGDEEVALLSELGGDLGYALQVLEERAKLARAEEGRRAAMAAGQVGLWDWDLGTNAVTYSREYTAQLGYTEEEFGEGFEQWRSRVHPDDLGPALARVNAFLARPEGRLNNEFRMRHKDGSWRRILAQADVLRDSAGRPVRMLGSHIDVTDLRRTEEALRESESYNRSLFEASPTGLALCRMDGSFVDLNPAFARIVGRTVEETLRLTYWEVTPGSYADQEAAQIASLEQTGRYGPYEKEYIHQDGHLVPVRLAGRILELGGERLIWSSVEDITERRRAEEERARLTGRIAEILESISDAFVALDRDWRYTYMNQKAGEIFGRDPKQMIGRHIWTEFPEGVGQSFHLAYERALETQEPTLLEEYYPPYDRWFENRIYPTPEGLSIFFHDITERKRAQTLLEDQKAILELIARGEGLDATLDALTRRVEARRPGMLCSILLLSPDGLHLLHGAAPSLPRAYMAAIDGEPIGPRAGSCGTAAYRREQVIVTDIAKDPLWDAYRDFALSFGLRACWSTPILSAEGRVLGTFAMYYSEPRSPSERDFELIGSATSLAGIAIERARAETALQRSEERLRLSTELAGVAVWEYDFITAQLSRTRNHDELYGLEWQGGRDINTFLNATHPDDREPLSAVIQEAVAAGGPDKYLFDFRVVHPNRAVHWLNVTGQVVVRDSRGQGVTARGCLSDITDRMRADQERQKFAMLADSSSEFIGMCDLNLQPIYVNPNGIRMVGLPDMAAACRVKVTDYFFPEDQAFIAEEFFPRVLREGHGDVEIRLRHFQTGEPIWVFYYLFGVRDASGKAVGWATVSRDITERRRAEAEGRRQSELMTRIMETSPVGIASMDLAGRILSVNARAAALVGLTQGQIAGRAFNDPGWRIRSLEGGEIPDEDLPFRQVMATGQPVYNLRHALEWPDGRRVLLAINAAPLIEEGRVTGVVTALEDITDQILAEETIRGLNAGLEQRIEERTRELHQTIEALHAEALERQKAQERIHALNASLERQARELKVANRHLQNALEKAELAERVKSAFLAAMSHELRTPLNSVIGFTGAMLGGLVGAVTAEQREALEIVQRNGQHLLALINDVLDLSKLEAGEMRLAREPFDLAGVVRQTVESVRPQAAAKGLTLEMGKGPASAPYHGDSRRVAQILLNLLSNALKFTQRGSVAVSMAAGPRGDHWELAVSDTGVGILPADLDRIFREFEQLDAGLARGNEGTGLGLALSRKMARLMGGDILVASERGRGSTFTLRLPGGA